VIQIVIFWKNEALFFIAAENILKINYFLIKHINSSGEIGLTW